MCANVHMRIHSCTEQILPQGILYIININSLSFPKDCRYTNMLALWMDNQGLWLNICNSHREKHISFRAKSNNQGISTLRLY